MSWYDTLPWTALYGDHTTPAPAPTSVLAALRAAVAAEPDRVALAYFDSRLTYREVDRLTDGVAAHLAANGFGAGGRLAIALQNVPQYVLALLGAWKAGGCVVPVNPMYRAAELTHLLTDAGVTALVCSQQYFHEIAAAVLAEVSVPLVYTTSELDLQSRDDARVLGDVTRRPAPGTVDLLDATATQAQPSTVESSAEPSAEDIALISYTSGTTGTPKGAVNTHGALAAGGATLGGYFGISRHATIFALAPLFHISGAVAQTSAVFANQGTLVLARRFEPGVVLDALVEHRPAFMAGAATAYLALMAHPDVTADHFRSFELLTSGGAPLPPSMITEFEQRFGHHIRNGYGLTETTGGCVAVPTWLRGPVDPNTGAVSVGIPMPGTVVRVVDDAGVDLPQGEQGEVAISGAGVVPGYWNRPRDTAAAFPGGRLLTGDIGYLDREGWLYLVDRKKDMISASGFKVWPREVEDVLHTHPAVHEAAVVGVADGYRGETVKAFVTRRPGADVDGPELIAHCRARLAAYKVPHAVEFRDQLPRNAAGKLLRRELA